MTEKTGIAEIISVGNELLSGRTVNTNAAFLSRELQKLGFDVRRVQTVADDETDIITALRNAVARAQVIILSGGLGPTDDDLTKETVAKVLGMPLQQNDEVLEDIKAFFESRGREMKENNVKQALVPRGAAILKNSNGTAPGIFIGNRSQAIVLLPGPPRELEPMFTEKLTPYLKSMATGFIKTAVLGVSGIGESELETRVKDILYGDNPHSALYAADGQVQIAISATADIEEEAEKLLKEKVGEFEEILGDNIFTHEGLTISQAVVKELMEKGKSVAVAESCTGGMMAQQITEIAGSSAIFQYGIASYSDRIKSSGLDVDRDLINKYTAVSSVVAAEMARGAKRNGRSDYGVGITGLAGPGNGGYYDKPVGLVYISVCDRKRTIVKKFTFGDKRDRGNIRRLATVNAFDMLRRLMNGYPIEDSFEFAPNDIADTDRYETARKKGGLLFKKSLSIVLIAGILAGACRYGFLKAAAAVRKKTYTRITSEYSETVKEKGMEGLAEVTAEHPAIIGWVSNGTGDVDTPVAMGRTDDFYTVKDFDGNNNILGACTVLAGTDMNAPPRNLFVSSGCEVDGIMLGSLEKYLDPGYAADHGWFRFCGSSFEQYYRLVSVLFLDGDADVQAIFRTHYFRNVEAAQQFIVNAEMRSIYNTGEPVYSDDSFLTLMSSADSMYEGLRVVVVAKAVDTAIEARSMLLPDQKETCVYPQAWYDMNGIEMSANITAESDYWRQWLLKNDTDKNGSGSLIDDVERYIRVSAGGQAVSLTPLDAVSRMVASDIGDAAYQEETLKAIAVADATRLKYSMANSGEGELIEVGTAEPSEKVIDAVSQVINMTLKYEGETCWTPVFLCSGGYTNSAEDVYGGSIPYLLSVISEYDSDLGENGYVKTIRYSTDDIKTLLKSTLGITVQGEDRTRWIEITSASFSGYVKEVSIDGQDLRSGSELFVDIMGLPSSNAIPSWSAEGLTVTCYGTGDGVGLSMGGADRYCISNSWRFEDILLHYYSGVQLVSEGWDDFLIN